MKIESGEEESIELFSTLQVAPRVACSSGRKRGIGLSI